MLSGFTSPVDIANRAIQNVGGERITAFTDPGIPAEETKFAYNKLRMYEMRRNVWRFSVRRAVIRALDQSTMVFTPNAYLAATTYGQGQIVTDTDAFGLTRWYFSRVGANVGNTPTNFGQYWEDYIGSKYAYLYDSTQSYYPGEIVYEQPAVGTINGYLCVVQTDTTNDPATTAPAAWDSTIAYRVGAIVSEGGVNYISLINENLNFDPASTATAWSSTLLTGSYEWIKLDGTFAPMTLLYPLGSGPVSQTFNQNAFPLPYGYLRDAPQDPKAGSISILGAPTYAMANDWVPENEFIVTTETEAIMLRFAADVTDVTKYDPMFCEGLAARIGMTICEKVTASTEKINTNAKMYTGFMGEARAVNSIEVGYDEPPMDDYISTRL